MKIWKKIVNLIVLNVFIFVLLPAETYDYLLQKNNSEKWQDVSRYDYKELNSEIEVSENDFFSDRACLNAVSVENEDYEKLIIYKTELYKKLVEAKRKITEDLSQINTSYELEQKWKNEVEKILAEFENSCDAGSFVLSDFEISEKKLFNSLLDEFLYDQKSLRFENDLNRADVVVEQLCSEVNGILHSDNLSQTDVGLSSANEKNLEKINSFNWQNENLSDIIENGLEQWEKAEREFLLQKGKWEKESEENYAENLEAWTKAYEKLKIKKTEWLTEITEKIESENEKWNNKKISLENELNVIKEEYEKKLDEETIQKKEIISSYEETLSQIDQVIESIQNQIETAKRQTGKESVQFVKNQSENLEKYKKMKETYLKDFQEYLLTFDELKNNNYELEKIECLEEYWQKQCQIKKALYEYALNRSSGAETKDETLEKFNLSEAEYQKQRNIYSSEIEKLKELENSYNEKKDEYDKQKARVSDLLEEYQLLEEQFNNINCSVTEVYLKNLKDEIGILVDQINDQKISESDVSEVSKKLIENLKNEEYENIEKNALELISQLENEYLYESDGKEVRIVSLDELELKYSQIDSESDDEEFTLYESRKAAIEFIKTGKIDENKYKSNIDFNEIIELYDEYSLEYIKEKDNETLENIKNIIEKLKLTEDNSSLQLTENEINKIISEIEMCFFENSSDYIRTAVDMFEVELENLINVSEYERLVCEVDSIFDDKNLSINFSFLTEFKNLVLGLDCKTAEGDRENIEELYGLLENILTCNDQNIVQLVNLIQNYNSECEDYETISKDVAVLRQMLAEKEAEYNEGLSLILVDNENGLYQELIKCHKNFTEQLDKVETEYEKLEKNELDYRIASEIKHWAENEYLHLDYEGSGLDFLKTEYLTAADRLEKCRLLKTEFEKKNDVLSEEENQLLCEYEDVLKIQFRLETLRNETEKQIESHELALKEAEEELNCAIVGLVNDFDSERFDASNVPEVVRDLVCINRIEDENGNVTYSVSYNDSKNHSDVSNQNDDSEKGESSNDSEFVSLLCEYEKNCGKEDSFDYIASFENKNYSIEDVMLALCYIKSQKDKYFFDGEDPGKNENYPFTLPTSSLYGIKFEDEYAEGRRDELKKAYDKIVSEDALDDVAKYILFSEYNFNPKLNLQNREIDVISYRSLQHVIDKVNEKRDEFLLIANCSAAAAALLSVIAAVPGFGGWALFPLAAATASCVTYFSNAEALRQCNIDISNIQRGYSEINQEYEYYVSSKLNTVKENSLIINEENEILNLLVNGSADYDNTFAQYEIGCIPLVEVNKLYDLYSKKLEAVKEKINVYVAEKKDEKNKLDAVSSKLEMQLLPGDNFSLSEFNSELEIVSGDNGAWNEQLFLSELNKKTVDAYLNSAELITGEDTYKNSCFESIKIVSGLIVDNDCSSKKDIKNLELELMKADCQSQFESWENSMQAVLENGNQEWQKSIDKINDSFISWNNEWNIEYNKKLSEINDSYEKLISDEKKWIYNQYEQADLEIPLNELNSDIYFSVGSMEIQNCESLINDSFNEIFDFNIDSLESVITDSFKYELTSRLESLDDLYSSEKIDEAVQNLQKAERQALSVYSSYLTDLEINKKIEEIKNQLKVQNENIEKWEYDLVRKDGYTVGNEISRNAIVDSLVFDTAVREKQVVHKYQWFELDNPVISVSENYAYFDSQTLEKILSNKMLEIQNLYYEIFGDENTAGQFSKHVGEAPIFADNIDIKKSRSENILKNGTGEMNLIMSDYIWNSAVNREGYVQLGLPLYDKKFTADNTILGIELPTIREISNMICSMVSNATGQVWINFFDDLVFGMMDVHLETKSIDSLLKDFLKSGVSSMVGSLSGLATNAISNVSSSLLRVTETAFVKTGASYLESVADNYIDSMSFENGFSIDWDKANSGWINEGFVKNALTSGLSYGTGQAVKLGLDKFNLKDGIGKVLNGNIFNVMGISSFNNIASTAAMAGVEYLMNGETSINLLSLRDLGYKGAGDSGLLSVKFSNDGVTAKISNSGSQVSLWDSLNFIPGIFESARISSAKIRNLFGDSKDLGIVNGINAAANSGNDTAMVTASEVWNKKINLYVEDMKHLGKAKDNNIYIKDTFVENNAEAAVQFASLLAHEGAHLYGGDELVARIEGYKTFLNLKNLYQISGDKYADISDIDYMANIYEKYGENYLFNALLYTNAFDKSKDDYDYYFFTTLDPKLRQNHSGNELYTLGDGWTKEQVEEYNNEMMKKQHDKYILDNYTKYISTLGENKPTVEEYLKSGQLEYSKFEDFKKIIELDFDNEKQILPDYTFNRETYETIKSAGCVLTTAVFLVYSITRKIVSLKDANEILKEKGLFQSSKDTNQKYLINYGKNYMDAVNAIAGETLISGYTARVDNEKGINGLLNFCEKSDYAYVGIVRVLGNGHATTLCSYQNSYTKDKNGDKIYSELTVINPWDSKSSLGASSYKMNEVSNLIMYRLNSKYRHNLEGQRFRKAYYDYILKKKEFIFK